jgi:enoyl-CoA hydratase/carnithine racemase
METIGVRDDGAVRTVTMNRPGALNALNAAMIDELADTLLATAGDARVKVMVLTGSGPAFSAGADLTEMGEPPRPARHGLPGMIEAFIDFPKPIIAAVNGLGVGYGATVLGLVDFVVMAEDARLRAPFSALGLTAELASTYRFPQLLGHQRAAWFLLSSEWMTAAECLAAGLAAEVVAGDRLAERVAERAAVLAALPSASLLATKELLVGPHRAAMKAAMVAENAALAELGGAPANREAVTAFLDKRAADFTGL